MIKSDPIIAVKDVEASSQWYQRVFDCKSIHDGDEFAVLEDQNGEVIICLHKWGEHEHPTMMNQSIMPGNGLILYFRTDRLDHIRENVRKMGNHIEEDIHQNPNSLKMEFSIKDPDGYYLTITEFHNYSG